MSNTFWHARTFVIETDGCWQIRIGPDWEYDGSYIALSSWNLEKSAVPEDSTEIHTMDTKITIWPDMVPQICDYLMTLTDDIKKRSGYSDGAGVAKAGTPNVTSDLKLKLHHTLLDSITAQANADIAKYGEWRMDYSKEMHPHQSAIADILNPPE